MWDLHKFSLLRLNGKTARINIYRETNWTVGIIRTQMFDKGLPRIILKFLPITQALACLSKPQNSISQYQLEAVLKSRTCIVKIILFIIVNISLFPLQKPQLYSKVIHSWNINSPCLYQLVAVSQNNCLYTSEQRGRQHEMNKENFWIWSSYTSAVHSKYLK